MLIMSLSLLGLLVWGIVRIRIANADPVRKPHHMTRQDIETTIETAELRRECVRRGWWKN